MLRSEPPPQPGPDAMRRKLVSKTPKSPEGDDFKSVARRLGCDDDKGRFEERLARMVRAKPKKRGKK